MKRMIYPLLSAALCAAPALQGCRFVQFDASNITFASDNTATETLKGSRTRASRDFDLEPFKSLEINGACELSFAQADTPSLTVEIGDNLLEHITVQQDGDRLVIGMDRHFKYNNATMEITLASPTLEAVEFNGAAEVKFEEFKTPALSIEANGASEMEFYALQGGKVSLELNGASEIDLRALDCKSLRIQANGASEVTASGRADEAKVNVAGTGDIDLSKLECPRKDAKVSGFGRVRK